MISEILNIGENKKVDSNAETKEHKTYRLMSLSQKKSVKYLELLR